MINDKLFQIRLKELLKEKKKEKVSNAEIADRIGKSHITISRWLNGVQVPDNSTIKLLAKELDVREEYLRGEDSYRTLDENDWRKSSLERTKKINNEKELLYSAIIEYMKFKNINSDQINVPKHFKSYLISRIESSIQEYLEYINPNVSSKSDVIYK